MDKNFDRWIYTLLAVTWLTVATWQYSAHNEARTGLRDELRDRAEDISRAIALVIRTDGRFSGVPQRRVEAVLEELTLSTDLLSVSMRDIDGNVVAKAGPDLPDVDEDFALEGAYWLPESAVFVNLVALTPRDSDGPFHQPPPGGPDHRDGVGRPDRGGSGRGRFFEGAPMPPPERGRQLPPDIMAGIKPFMNGTPLSPEAVKELLTYFPKQMLGKDDYGEAVTLLTGKTLTVELLGDLQHLMLDRDAPRQRRGGPGPRWNDWDRERILDKRGIHAFALQVPATDVYEAEAEDLRMRLLLLGLVSLVCIVILILLRIVRRSATLDIRLARSEAMTTHLRELNTAAAGLVHETKNPLNLIRGQAQMLERGLEPQAKERDIALRIMEESDRVAGRLNQFLDYSRPLEPVLAEVDLSALVNDIFAVLECDREDKKITLSYGAEGITIVRADAGLLRQVLFNLLINAIEAVPQEGHINVQARKGGRQPGSIEIADDGPGVADALRDQLFQPYVTGTETGTGLGLTIVRQIVLAHGWAITQENSPTGGAIFGITHVEVVQ